jgi:hypothetical protein
LGIGQDRVDCGDGLGGEGLGLLAPGEVLILTSAGEGVSKNGRTKPIADGIAVDAGQLSGGGGGGTGGQQGENALLGRFEGAIGRHDKSS